MKSAVAVMKDAIVERLEEVRLTPIADMLVRAKLTVDES